MVSQRLPSCDRVRSIVFDLDGTLYQNEEMGEEVNLCSCRFIASLKGVSVEMAALLISDERIRLKEQGGTLSRAVEALGGNLKELHQKLGEEVHPEGILTVDPRVPALLDTLAKRFELVIYTNNNRLLSARIMKEIGVAERFGKIFTIEDFWQPKPDQGALKGILQGLGRSPAETLFVGDRYDVDLKLPEALGCQVFLAKTTDELLRLGELCPEPPLPDQ